MTAKKNGKMKKSHVRKSPKANKFSPGAIARKIPLHPLFISAFPVIALFVHNSGELHVGSVNTPLFYSVLAAGALLLLLNLAVKDWLKSGLVVSVLSMAFFSYGQVFNLLGDLDIAGFQLANHALLMAVYLMACAWAIWLILRAEGYIEEITMIANFAAVLLFCVSAFQAVDATLSYDKKMAGVYNSRVKVAPPADYSPKKYPDIYYIILDGHARQDVMKDIYGYDNTAFIKELEGMGFYVALKSTPNYCQTYLSLSSSLNMEYLDEAAKMAGSEERSRNYYTDMIRGNKLFKFLKQNGYATASYFSGFVGTELKHIVDTYLPGDNELGEDISNFSNVLLQSTIISGVESFINLGSKIKVGPQVAFRRRTRYILENLSKATEIRSPKIVFAHMICPHPPFVFDENGPTDKYVGTKGVEFTDGSQNALPKEVYVRAYAGQARYLDARLPVMVKALMDKYPAGGKPIIILQRDHGPGSQWDAEDVEKTNTRERFSIFNAYYLPYGGNKMLYDSISPVNSFRVVLNYYFGQKLPLLPDKSYFTPWSHPYKFIDVTGKGQIPAPDNSPTRGGH